MPQAKHCPECGGSEFKPAGGGRLRCVSCGADLAYHTPWLAVVLTWAIVAVVLGAGSKLLAHALGLDWNGAARWIPVFLLIAFLSNLISRRFRRLHRA